MLAMEPIRARIYGTMAHQTGDNGRHPTSGLGPESDPVPLLQVVWADLRAAAGWRLVGVLGVLAWMVFQWGFGNDAILPSVAANAFYLVDDGQTWWRGVLGVLAAAAAGGGFWALTQTIDGLVVVAGLTLVPGISGRLSNYLRGKGWVTPYEEMRWSTRWMISYATGTSVLCLVDVFATGRHGVRHRLGLILTAAGLAAGTVTLVTIAVVTAAMIATRVPATEAGAEVFIRWARNPLTWIAIFATVFVIGRLRSWRRRPATVEGGKTTA
jgi:hypothetical protein